jgi:cholinesterase
MDIRWSVYQWKFSQYRIQWRKSRGTGRYNCGFFQVRAKPFFHSCIDEISYRLSILGFPGNPNGTANVALMDQRLAIEWVRDNIENFGGDKSRITIFGQSAGGVSVDLYSYAYNSDPIAAGFIPESGTVFSWGLPNSKATAAQGWYGTAQNLGCGNSSSNSAALLACMRSKNSTALLAAIPQASGINGILGVFGPTVDDTIVFSNYTGRTPAKVPTLLGNTDYEAGLFRVQFGLANVTLPDRFWTAFDLQEFTCPAGIRANASLTAENPTWRYRYMGVWDNTALSPQSGAYHTAEIPVLFNTAPSNPPATEEYIAVGDYMRGAWAAFAKDPVKGLTNYGWPSYSVSSDSLIRLAYENKTGTNAVSPSLYDANCRFVNVSSTDASAYTQLPEDTTPTQTSSSSPSPTGSAAASATTNAGTQFSASLSAVLMGAAMLYLL